VRRAFRLVRFVRDWRTYAALPGSERLRPINSFPQLGDDTAETTIERHYFYQAIWAAQHVARSKVDHHVDVGSDHRMVAMLTTHARVSFIDIRPLAAPVEGLGNVAGSVTQLPFRDASVASLSCLHVAEHIGLGRYGDPLDPLGSHKAAAELSRVLAPGGNLYFSVPVGWSRVEFNAHRVHTPCQILSYFPDLKLLEFSVEDDELQFHANVKPGDYERADYACGLFWFTKPEKPATVNTP
jgi:SAM-dependent methyltransferase